MICHLAGLQIMAAPITNEPTHVMDNHHIRLPLVRHTPIRLYISCNCLRLYSMIILSRDHSMGKGDIYFTPALIPGLKVTTRACEATAESCTTGKSL